VGGASNTGGGVLKSLGFTPQKLQELSSQIDPSMPSPLDYYPLVNPGERFPVCDPDLEGRLSPRPDSEVEFLHGILESMSRIEKDAFDRLEELGASPVKKVFTAGGGSSNETWLAIRQRRLGVPVLPSKETEAAYGTALLAMRGMLNLIP